MRDLRRRLTRSLVAGALASLGLGITAVGPAQAAVVCGQSITSDTTLTADLTCPGNGLFITASDVTLDLNGHTITGTKQTDFSAGVTVSSGRARARITGGTIRGFNRAIGVNPGADGAHIHNMRLENNELGIGLFEFTLGSFPRDARIVSNVIVNPGPFSGLQLAGRGHVVQHNTITNGASTGIFLIGSDMMVANNQITGSGANGIAIGPSPGNPGPFADNQLLGNRVSGSGRLFTSGSVSIRNAQGTEVSGNSVNGRPIGPALIVENSAGTVARANVLNGGNEGVLVRGSSSATTVLQNRIHDNNVGVLVQGPSTGTHLNGNAVHGNRFDGIHVMTSSATVTGNTAFSNGQWGIRAVAGVTDGGGNRAFGNGVAAQCTPNIAC